eukprot:4769794-Karenia_brevis.AAC.1
MSSNGVFLRTSLWNGNKCCHYRPSRKRSSVLKMITSSNTPYLRRCPPLLQAEMAALKLIT